MQLFDRQMLPAFYKHSLVHAERLLYALSLLSDLSFLDSLKIKGGMLQKV